MVRLLRCTDRTSPRAPPARTSRTRPRCAQCTCPLRILHLSYSKLGFKNQTVFFSLCMKCYQIFKNFQEIKKINVEAVM